MPPPHLSAVSTGRASPRSEVCRRRISPAFPHTGGRVAHDVTATAQSYLGMGGAEGKRFQAAPTPFNENPPAARGPFAPVTHKMIAHEALNNVRIISPRLIDGTPCLLSSVRVV